MPFAALVCGAMAGEVSVRWTFRAAATVVRAVDKTGRQVRIQTARMKKKSSCSSLVYEKAVSRRLK